MHFFLFTVPLAIILLAYSNRLIDPALLSKYFVFAVYLLILWIYTLIKFKGRINELARKILNPLFLCFIGYLLVSGISLSYTINFADGLFMWCRDFLWFLFLFLLTIHLTEKKDFIVPLTNTVTLFAFTIAIMGIFQLFEIINSAGLTHLATYRVKATFAHRNLYSEVLLLTLPFTAYVSFNSTGARYFKWAGIVAMIFSIALIFILMTRAVWLAFAVGLAVAGGLFIIREMQSKFKLRRVVFLIIIFSITSLAFLFYSKTQSGELIKKQLTSSLNLQHGSTKDRIDIWKKSLRLFKESPFQGTGAGGWEIEMVKFGTDNMLSSDDRTFFQRPHNDFLWVLTESGIAALAFYLFIFLLSFHFLIRLIKSAVTPNQKQFYYLMLFGLTGYMMFSFFSFPKERIEQGVLLTLIMAPVIAEYQKLTNKNRNPFNSFTLFSLLTVVLMLSIYVGYKRIIAETHTLKAFEARSENNWPKVIREIKHAENAFYTLDPMSTPLAWYSGSAYFNLGQTDKALNEFSKAYEIHPYHIHVLNNLATCYELKGEHEKAIALYKKAITISPVFNDALLNLSAVYFNQDSIDSACFYLRRVNIKTNDSKYVAFQNAILPALTLKIMNEVEEPFLKEYINRIKNTPAWYQSIHRKSIENNIPYKAQLIMDALHIFGEEEKSISFDKIKAAKLKYNLK